MVNPLIALITFFITAILLSVLFWPDTGLYHLWKSKSLLTKRVLIEDALKHIYDCEYKNVQCSLNSVAGNLSISADASSKLLNRLEEMKLAKTGTESIQLTNKGRNYALKVIRVHRLWEKYLAEETGVDQLDWHSNAEVKEHVLTPEEVDDLAAKLNNPLFDPHGDPIPTTRGQVPSLKGKALTELEEGEFAVIIHLEDEPHAIFSQLIALGLYPGMQIQMIKSTMERIVFEANGEQQILAPLFAKNVTVSPIQNFREVKNEFQTLASLKTGEESVVMGISKACRGKQRRRLMDLGIVPGTRVSALMRSFGGDPIAFLIRGGTIALRKEQADYIFINKKSMKENE